MKFIHTPLIHIEDEVDYYIAKMQCSVNITTFFIRRDAHFNTDIIYFYDL